MDYGSIRKFAKRQIPTKSINDNTESNKEIISAEFLDDTIIVDDRCYNHTDRSLYANPVNMLLDHPLTSMITNDQETSIFVLCGSDGKTENFQGITRSIKECFFPDYEFPVHRRGKSSKKIGEKVHRQICHQVECIERRLGECVCIGGPPNYRKVHPWAQQAFDCMRQMNIEPMACEIPILSQRAQRCTRIDAIGIRRLGEPSQSTVHISFKTGYDVSYDVNSLGQKMKSPLNNIISSPKNHNKLQLLIEKMILKVEYGIEFDEHIIMYLGHGEMAKPHVEGLDGLVTKAQDERNVYDEFCRYCIESV